jgi:hypothetical protein
MEIITFLGSYLLKSFQNHIASKTELRKLELEMMITQRDGQNKAREAVRANPILAITASVLAIMGFFAIILLPKLVCIFMPDVAVTYAYLDTSKGFLFFTSDTTKMFFKSLSGLLITPIDTHLIAAISGLYFGSVTGRRG